MCHQNGIGNTHSRGGIVVLGGFASPSAIYAGLCRTLELSAGRPVYLVGAQTHDWLPSLVPAGWRLLLDKLDGVVRRAAAAAGGRVTLVGHSAGGVVSRLYLSSTPFFGRSYGGCDYVDCLVTLGSPHYNRQPWIHGGLLSRWIQRRCPDAFFGDRVRYVTVVGRLLQGDSNGSARARYAHRFYHRICGRGEVWGDGLIPVESALLAGAQHVVLDGVAHFNGFGGPWYGAPQIVEQWWRAATTGASGGPAGI